MGGNLEAGTDSRPPVAPSLFVGTYGQGWWLSGVQVKCGRSKSHSVHCAPKPTVPGGIRHFSCKKQDWSELQVQAPGTQLLEFSSETTQQEA